MDVIPAEEEPTKILPFVPEEPPAPTQLLIVSDLPEDQALPLLAAKVRVWLFDVAKFIVELFNKESTPNV